jgi:hypothetical protein
MSLKLTTKTLKNKIGCMLMLMMIMMMHHQLMQYEVDASGDEEDKLTIIE